MIDRQAQPQRFEPFHGVDEVIRLGSERDGVECAGRRAAENREWVGCMIARNFRKRLQHANLIGRARAAAREQQGGMSERVKGVIEHRS